MIRFQNKKIEFWLETLATRIRVGPKGLRISTKLIVVFNIWPIPAQKKKSSDIFLVCVTWLATFDKWKGLHQNRQWVLGTLRNSHVRQGEECFEPVLDTHTPLSRTVTPLLLIGLSSSQQPKKISKKNRGGADFSLAPPQFKAYA
jgi:hypothetical protein